MATTPTQDAVPSESPRDLKYNAGKIDEFVTSLALKYADRFGGEHYTIEGLSWLAQQAIAQYGWIPVGTFQAGASLTMLNQILKDETDGEYYRWDGTFPKTVTTGSTPGSSGGVGAGAWISVGDAALRSQISDPEGASKYPGLQVARWRDSGDVRGWGPGEAGFNAAMNEVSANGGGVLYVRENITFTSIPIRHLPRVTVYWEAVAKVKSGLAADYAYIMDGGALTPSYDKTDHFTRANKTNCYNLYLMAEDYLIGINAKALCVKNCYGWEYTGGALIGFNNGGVYETNNYEGRASKFTLVVANTRLDDSIGFESNSTDSWFSEFSPVGYSIGAKFNKSANSLDKFHPWGNTIDGRVGALGRMNVGLIVTENAGFSKYSNLILDTPVRKNTGAPASRTNGGVGLINDAWDTVFDCVTVLPSRYDAVVKSTLLMINSGQRCSMKDISVSDANFVNDFWVSFEGGSGVARNHISGIGYAQYMRTGGVIGLSSGASFAAANDVTISQQTLSSGINGNVLSFSISTTIVAKATATSDVVMNISSIYGITSGFSGFVKGGMDAFFYSSANSSKQLNNVSVDIVSDNTAKFLLTFVDGTSRYARWNDVSNISAKSISISGKIDIR